MRWEREERGDEMGERREGVRWDGGERGVSWEREERWKREGSEMGEGGERG